MKKTEVIKNARNFSSGFVDYMQTPSPPNRVAGLTISQFCIGQVSKYFVKSDAGVSDAARTKLWSEGS